MINSDKFLYVGYNKNTNVKYAKGRCTRTNFYFLFDKCKR